MHIVSIPQAVGTITSSSLFSLPFSQGLEMCGPHRHLIPLLPRTLRRIPQAVGTVATSSMVYLHDCDVFHVSIPQAVSTVATFCAEISELNFNGFNTASGKYCCNPTS